jgi:hypothetical protein
MMTGAKETKAAYCAHFQHGVGKEDTSPWEKLH